MNLASVLIATVASTILAFLWYSPYVFGKPWMYLTGMDHKHAAERRGMFLPLLVSILASFLTAAIFESAKAEPSDMIKVLLLLWLVFAVALRLPHYLFEGRSLKLFLIYAGHDLVNLLLIGSIVSIWE